MRIPLTDQFLLDLYNLLEKLNKNTEDLFALRTMREAICPDIFKMRRNYERKKAKKQFSQFISYLKKNGYIEIKNLKEKKGMLLTEKGMNKVLDFKFKTEEKKIRPDGKWQMIIFDIPEKKRHLRILLRGKLVFLGYKMLQQSVWVCPYDVFEETEKFLRKNSLDQYIRIFLIEKIC